jgi:hypothetical protein
MGWAAIVVLRAQSYRLYSTTAEFTVVPLQRAEGGWRLASKRRTMSKAIENLEAAFQKAMAIRPKIGGFPGGDIAASGR